jgi:hypothetical protein
VLYPNTLTARRQLNNLVAHLRDQNFFRHTGYRSGVVERDDLLHLEVFRQFELDLAPSRQRMTSSIRVEKDENTGEMPDKVPDNGAR